MYIVQSVLLSREHFTRDEAIDWVRKNNYHARKIDITPDYFRFRQVSPEALPFTARYRTIDLGKIGKLVVVYM